MREPEPSPVPAAAPPPAPPQPPRRLDALELWTLALVAFADQASKALVRQMLPLGDSRSIIPNLLDFTHVHNTGAAFGLLNAADFPYKSTVMILVAGLALVVIATYATQLGFHERLARFGLALILGGAVGNLIDRAVLGNHIWTGSVTHDPEGIMSTFPAIGTAMLGVFAGRWINTDRPLIERIAGLFAVGSLAMVLGRMWNWSFPINKNLWTSSYVLFTAGKGCVTLATCMWIIDHLEIRGWIKPFVIYGMNPIVAFVGSGVLARIIYTLWKVPYNGKMVPVQRVMYETIFASWLPDKLASLGFALLTVLFWFGVLSWLYRKKFFLKV